MTVAATMRQGCPAGGGGGGGSGSDWTQFDPADFTEVDDTASSITLTSLGDGWYRATISAGATNGTPPDMLKFTKLLKSPYTDGGEVGRVEGVLEFRLADTDDAAQPVLMWFLCDADGNANNVSDTHRVLGGGLRTGTSQYHLVTSNTTSLTDHPTGDTIQDLAFVDFAIRSSGSWDVNVMGFPDTSDTEVATDTSTIGKSGDLYLGLALGNEVDGSYSFDFRAKYQVFATATMSAAA